MCKGIIAEFLQMPESGTSVLWDDEPFLEPVPWKEWGLDDYPRIIKQPMDLGTVNKKMTAGEYKDIFEFAYDMRLIWRNCCTYNQEGAEIYAVGKKLSDVFEEKFSSVQSLSLFPPTCSTNKILDVNCREPSVATKREFVDDLFRLTPQDLAKVIETLNDRCESCLDKTNPELVDIIVDAIDNATFNYTFGYVKDLLKKDSPSAMEVENYPVCSQTSY
ncbi:hypothetical protein JH06_1429 [Blastocystis sp. subtype 4]|uniref:hypothetical protein n=1 Tax=Blastocystis sp. subtype 4 TaxID=944170 RepID=UPI0007116862|nr:hypothetical protein JH06_1429 [Blastocystis sp. subtype 4]KNB44841.1 hypothetical protein JH06_1429 [Blastocystis sp. subtype 4]|eukprot:XP_014528283.1 hypothetical protein JH06_1429 [Blastocystis sp. subtype 4]